MNFRLSRKMTLASAITMALALTTQVSADESELLDVLLQNGVITQEQHDAIKDKYVDKKESDQDEINEKVATAVKEDPALSIWSKIEPNADFRFRYETENRSRAGQDPNRDRYRLRARFGFKYNLDENTNFGFQLASGSDDPISTNQTLGDRFSSKPIQLDLAYAQHSFFDGKLTGVVGKYKNPYFGVSQILFDDDLRFEGVSVTGNLPVSDTGAKAFLTGSVHPLDELSNSSDDPYLFAGQAGVGYSNDAVAVTAAVGYYDFEVNSAIDESVTSNTTNNFNGVINPNIAVDIKTLPVFVGFFGEYVNNTDVSNDETGYLFGAKFGKEKVKVLWDWQVAGYYERIEANATYDELNFSDFRGGGTNSKGFVVGYQLGLGKGWSNSLTYINADEINGARDSRERFQADLNYKF